MRGTTLYVASFWMFACTRSLTKRASRSSTYSLPQSVLSNDASPGLLDGSSRPPDSAANTDDTLFSPRARISWTSSGLGNGTPGTYQSAEGSSEVRPSDAYAKRASTWPLQEPHPVAARVAAQSVFRLRLPERTASTMA